MDKRFFLALLLTGVVLVVTPLLFPPPPRAATAGGTASEMPELNLDATAPASANPGVPSTAVRSVAPVGRERTGGASESARTRATRTALATDVIDTIHASGAGAAFVFSTQGASPKLAELPQYRSLGATSGAVILQSGADPLLQYSVLSGTDTVRLDRTIFRYSRDEVLGGTVLTFTSPDTANPATVIYRLQSNAQITHVEIAVPKVTDRAYLILGLPRGFLSHEADA